jgi:hypothetical protein
MTGFGVCHSLARSLAPPIRSPLAHSFARCISASDPLGFHSFVCSRICFAYLSLYPRHQILFLAAFETSVLIRIAHVTSSLNAPHRIASQSTLVPADRCLPRLLFSRRTCEL